MRRLPVPFSEIRLRPDRLQDPLHWRRPRVVFVCNMGDWMHDQVPVDFLLRMATVIRSRPEHVWLMLTKRVHRLREVVRENRLLDFSDSPNVWIMASVCNQEMAGRDVPILLDTPAARRGLSVEPMLGPVSFRPEWLGQSPWSMTDARLDWVVCGCESGPGRRPMEALWWDSLREQCATAGVPVYLKQQAGSWSGGDWYPSCQGLGKVHGFDPTERDMPADIWAVLGRRGREAAPADGER